MSNPEALTFPAADALGLEPHLPPPFSRKGAEEQKNISQQQQNDAAAAPSTTARGGERKTETKRNKPKPFVTLTFAISLDSSLSLAPGTRTILSGPQSKAMTHYLRSRHAAICVGVGTAIADDPGLNCRLLSASPSKPQHQPRPIVIDPNARWALKEDAKVLQLARAGLGLAPFIAVASATSPDDQTRELLERHGGKYIFIDQPAAAGNDQNTSGAVRFNWDDVLAVVMSEGLESIMIEGGGQIINSLLAAPENELIDSVIVTIAPTWLGQGGVVVSPPRTVGADGELVSPVRLTGVSWHPLGEDVVMCGKILR
ncbi:putative riboflavin biosynthesis protein Rib7 [Apodospora peruviana]|uniref:2,5-diamino-6-ribosylamino-4(3H)-pyrimidinone 5'-phosphate reductase n=1 Tax=Apodospora peruviana TaxID=516989 RepID=A0AAE0M4K8_9PEZI|nr:putative riboflavin biosynthesis protein Rib7 [Apodospora peruviana]